MSSEASSRDPLNIYSVQMTRFHALKPLQLAVFIRVSVVSCQKLYPSSGRLASCSLGQQGHSQRTCQSVRFMVADQAQSVCVTSPSASECTAHGEPNVPR